MDKKKEKYTNFNFKNHKVAADSGPLFSIFMVMMIATFIGVIAGSLGAIYGIFWSFFNANFLIFFWCLIILIGIFLSILSLLYWIINQQKPGK